jgi:hypothetical protein
MVGVAHVQEREGMSFGADDDLGGTRADVDHDLAGTRTRGSRPAAAPGMARTTVGKQRSGGLRRHGHGVEMEQEAGASMVSELRDVKRNRDRQRWGMDRG